MESGDGGTCAFVAATALDTCGMRRDGSASVAGGLSARFITGGRLDKRCRHAFWFRAFFRWRVA